MLESIVVSTVLCGSVMSLEWERERRMVKVSDMKCLRKVFGAGVMHRILNRNKRERSGNAKSDPKYPKVIWSYGMNG